MVSKKMEQERWFEHVKLRVKYLDIDEKSKAILNSLAQSTNIPKTYESFQRFMIHSLISKDTNLIQMIWDYITYPIPIKPIDFLERALKEVSLDKTSLNNIKNPVQSGVTIVQPKNGASVDEMTILKSRCENLKLVMGDLQGSDLEKLRNMYESEFLIKLAKDCEDGKVPIKLVSERIRFMMDVNNVGWGNTILSKLDQQSPVKMSIPNIKKRNKKYIAS